MNNIETKTGRILIVDDEEIVHQTLNRLLVSGGYTIDSAYGGDEALSMIGEGYDLIICDIRMPDIDGIEVLRQIKKRDLPVEVIMLTGYATLESATDAMNYGARGYLMKPIENIPEFRSKVSEAVHISQITCENREFYEALMSGQVDSLMIDGKPQPVPALREELKEILQRLIQVISDGVVILDYDGSITFANVNFAQMIGESYQKMLGSQFESYLPDGEQDKLVEAITRLSRGQVAINIQTHLKTCFGRLLSVIISCAPFYYEMEYRGISMVISDITEVDRVRGKVELLANLVENAQYDMIFIVKPEGQILECNNIARSTFGYSQSEMLSQNIGALLKSEDGGWGTIVDSVERGSHWRGEPIAISRDGGEFPVEMTVSRSFSKVDESVNVICFMRDITERKRIEEELKHKNIELERLVYTISHDLRAPLVNIEGFASMLRKALKRNETEKIERDLEYIEKGAIQMGHLLSDTLKLARIGRVINEPEDVSFRELIGEALDELAEKIESKNIEISVAEGFPAVYVDRLRMIEVLVNLIENSIKVTAGEQHPRIEIGHRLDDGKVAFFVRDTGIGLDPSQHEKVFDLFYMVDPGKMGTGVGLAIVKRIIEAHDGSIWIESEKGEGCAVCFTLPIAGDRSVLGD